MTIQTSHIKTITYIPLSHISRPIPPVLDEQKIDSMRNALRAAPKPVPKSHALDANSSTPTEFDKTFYTTEEVENHEPTLPAVDVMVVSLEGGVKKVLAFGGCHRLESYNREKWGLIPCKTVPCSRSSLKIYLGSSADRVLGI